MDNKLKTLHIVPSIYARDDVCHIVVAVRHTIDPLDLVPILEDAIRKLKNGSYRASGFADTDTYTVED